MIIAYWLAGLRSTLTAFCITSLASILILNVSTACGCFFSAAFNSVPLAMAYLVPFDYILMTTSGVFISLYTLPQYLAWMPQVNWLMYGNELMSIAQWSGVTNISKIKFPSLISILILISCLIFYIILSPVVATKKACNAADESTFHPCYQTGEEVLQHYNFSESHFYVNFIAMILLYVLFHLLGYIFLCRRTRRVM